MSCDNKVIAVDLCRKKLSLQQFRYSNTSTIELESETSPGQTTHVGGSMPCDAVMCAYRVSGS